MALTGEARFKFLKDLAALGANLSEQQIADALAIGLITQAEAEAGTATTIRFLTAERVRQAIEALAAGGALDTTNFGGVLSSADDTVQKALDTLDDIVVAASGISTDTTNFGGSLSSADNTVQKALDTLDDATPATATESAEGLLEKATDAEIQAATTGAKAICAEDLKTAAAPEALTDAVTVAVDWSSAINFTLTMTADRTLGNPTNEIPGTWRTVLVKGNDATARTLSFDTEYGGTKPTLNDITSTRFYLISIYCKDTSKFLVSAIDGSD